MSFNYITIGYDCSPAAALKNLNLREFALPFDWVVSSITCLEKCFETNFEHFHKNLTMVYNKKRLIDYYGFQFPHDYPLNDASSGSLENIGEGVFGEEDGKFITVKWPEYYNIVLDKYNRRIERFKHIMNDTKPIIVLSRYSTKDVLQLQNLFIKYYKLNNVYFINSFSEEFENDKIKNIFTEKNNIWNESAIWEEGINYVIKNKLT